MADHPFDGCVIEQVGGVLDAPLDRISFFPEADLQVDGQTGRAHRHPGDLEDAQGPIARELLVLENDLEERILAEFPIGMKRLDELLIGQVRVILVRGSSATDASD